MNWSKNLYVFMLSALIVFSGCIGTGTTNGEDDDVGTTVINNYYNNTTNVIENTPEYITDTGLGPKGTILITINQSANTAIHILDWSGTSEGRQSGTTGNWTEHQVASLRVNTNCTNGMVWGETLSYNTDSSNDQWLAGTGLECTHSLTTQGPNYIGWEFNDSWMSAIYQISPVVVA